MIRLTRINHVPLVLNSDLIEHLEATPDTVIALTTGQKLVVLESADEVIQKVIDFRRSIAGPPQLAPVQDGGAHRTEVQGSEAEAELWPVKPVR
jgi:flagellar protein FlbD